jgi:hypothetical protein
MFLYLVLLLQVITYAAKDRFKHLKNKTFKGHNTAGVRKCEKVSTLDKSSVRGMMMADRTSHFTHFTSIKSIIFVTTCKILMAYAWLVSPHDIKTILFDMW